MPTYEALINAENTAVERRKKAAKSVRKAKKKLKKKVRQLQNVANSQILSVVRNRANAGEKLLDLDQIALEAEAGLPADEPHARHLLRQTLLGSAGLAPQPSQNAGVSGSSEVTRD